MGSMAAPEGAARSVLTTAIINTDQEHEMRTLNYVIYTLAFRIAARWLSQPHAAARPRASAERRQWRERRAARRLA
jgi:hypothetical protein